MKKRIFLFVFIAGFFSFITVPAQNTKGKKSGDPGVEMSKTDNRMTVKGEQSVTKDKKADGDISVSMRKQEMVSRLSESVPEGVQADTKSVEEIVGNAALCRYSVKLKDISMMSEHGVCWGKEAEPVISGDRTISKEKKGPNFIGEMTNLEADTKYYVRAYVTTTAGTVYGKELSFTTASGSVNSTYWIRRR